jgi:cell wall assembly regulator SMI1
MMERLRGRWNSREGGFLGASEILETLTDLRSIAKELLDARRYNGVSADMTLTATGSVKNNFWSEHWIPFHVTDWSKICFDFDPPQRGEMGQIIEVDWEGGSVKVIARNYTEFLEMCADGLPDEPAE